jgi:hypothetical protein
MSATSLPSPPYHHFLIGLPGSGKSALAQLLAAYEENATIISGNTDVLSQIQTAVADGKTVIYEATNSRRCDRLDILQKIDAACTQPQHWIAWYVKTPKKQHRDSTIHAMARSLAQFPPDTAEGFAQVKAIATVPEQSDIIDKTVRNIHKSITNRASRTKNNHLCHRYACLLDFERLLHLISLLLQFPGIGGLSENQPEVLKEIFGEKQTFASDIAEMCAIMERQKGAVYAQPEELATDLDWLQRNGFFTTTATSSPIEINSLPPSQVTNSKEYQLAAWHRYSDADVFRRLMEIIRCILHEPFANKRETTSNFSLLQTLSDILQEKQIFISQDTVRRDIECALKPYGLLPERRMRNGYFLGTGIFRESELAKIYAVLQAQQIYSNDPMVVETIQKFRDRVTNSKLLELESIYPTRAIGNRGIVNPKRLQFRDTALVNHLHRLEKAIEQGELLEFAIIPGSGRFEKQEERENFQAYPLQMVFHNIAWYLGFQRQGGERDGLLYFERLDRLDLMGSTQTFRSQSKQKQALDELTRLYVTSAGIYLGKEAAAQRKYLSKYRSVRQSVEMVVELWMSDRIFAFVREGNQRFPRSQMQMSRPQDRRVKESDKSLFCLQPSGDNDFPNRFRVTLPVWSQQDVDLKRWILGFGPQVKVVRPQALVEKIYKEAKAIADNYQIQEKE